MDDGKLGRFIKMLSVHRVIMKYELNVSTIRLRGSFSRIKQSYTKL